MRYRICTNFLVANIAIWNAYDLEEATSERGFSTVNNSTKATIDNGIVTCMEPGFVIVTGKLNFKNTAGAQESIELIITIEEN